MKKIFAWFIVLTLLLCGCHNMSRTPNLPASTLPPISKTQTDTSTEPSTEDASNSKDKLSEIAPTALPDDSSFEITFLDVGQADSALISCDGEYMLIDGGNKADSNLVYSVLDQRGIDQLSLVVGTHAHEDHIGGLSGALNYATADMILCPTTYYDSDAFKDFARYAGQTVGINVPSVGDHYSLGSADIHIMAVNSDDDTNNTSIVLKITYGETSFLFTGDAEYETEQMLLNSGVDLSATVLKIAHHGSDTSTSYHFLREVMPQYAVISCGVDNSYGHPTDSVLSRLRDADVSLYRTDLQGDIICTSDGHSVTFTADKIIDNDINPNDQPTITDMPDTSTDSNTVYVLNTRSHKFHYPSCHSVAQMSPKNYATSSENRETIISQGFSPCGNCDP